MFKNKTVDQIIEDERYCSTFYKIVFTDKTWIEFHGEPIGFTNPDVYFEACWKTEDK